MNDGWLSLPACFFSLVPAPNFYWGILPGLSSLFFWGAREFFGELVTRPTAIPGLTVLVSSVPLPFGSLRLLTADLGTNGEWVMRKRQPSTLLGVSRRRLSYRPQKGLERNRIACWLPNISRMLERSSQSTILLYY
jgi:hypothetical protein